MVNYEETEETKPDQRKGKTKDHDDRCNVFATTALFPSCLNSSLVYENQRWVFPIHQKPKFAGNFRKLLWKLKSSSW